MLILVGTFINCLLFSIDHTKHSFGLPWWLRWYRIHVQCNRSCFDTWLGKIPQRRDRLTIPVFLGFTGGSAGKESTYKAGDLDSIPGLGRSPGGRHATHSSIFGWRTLLDRRTWWATAHGITESDMTNRLST